MMTWELRSCEDKDAAGGSERFGQPVGPSDISDDEGFPSCVRPKWRPSVPELLTFEWDDGKA